VQAWATLGSQHPKTTALRDELLRLAIRSQIEALGRKPTPEECNREVRGPLMVHVRREAYVVRLSSRLSRGDRAGVARAAWALLQLQARHGVEHELPGCRAMLTALAIIVGVALSVIFMWVVGAYSA
jgi:hypothetical protein